MTTDIFDKTPAADLDDDQLAERVVGYASQIAALNARMLDYLGEFDSREAWRGDGLVASCAHWLAWQTGTSLRTAQEHVRVARALRELPVLREQFRAGRLSFSKVRALARVATPDREPELVNFAQSATAAQVEKLCGAIRDIDAEWESFMAHRNDELSDEGSEAEPPPPESWGRWSWNYDGTLTVNLRLNAVDGARLLAGVVRSEYERTRTLNDPDLPAPDDCESPERSESTDRWRNVPSNIAPALTAMSDTVIAGIKVPEVVVGADILVHQVDDDVALDDGPALRSAEREELECGATVREIGHGHGDSMSVAGRRMGPTLRWGHKRRVPNSALVKTILMRDRGCQAPGCGRSRHLHIHHVKFWSAGGTTDPDNLILLCGSHHRALHHGAFTIEALGDQRFAFRGTHGEPLITAPLHAAPDTQWYPDIRVSADGVTPRNRGRCDLRYTTEVLYDAWDWKARQPEQAAA